MVCRATTTLVRLAGVVALLPWLASCADSGFSDLDAFMEEKRVRPGGVIEPIPTFRLTRPLLMPRPRRAVLSIVLSISGSWRHCPLARA